MLILALLKLHVPSTVSCFLCMQRVLLASCSVLKKTKTDLLGHRTTNGHVSFKTMDLNVPTTVASVLAYTDINSFIP